MIQRTLVTGLLLVGAFAVSAPSPTYAFGRKADLRSRIGQKVKQALDAVKASPAQRARLQPAVDRVLSDAEVALGAKSMPELDELLTMFAGDRLDTNAVAALRQQRDQRHERLSDALSAAFVAAHDALDPTQRQKLIDHVRGKSDGKRMRQLKQSFRDGMVGLVVEDMLDRLGATTPEREAVHGARDAVIGALKKAQGDPQAALDQLAALFRADKIDSDALMSFRKEKEAQVRELTAACERAFTQVHAALTPEHRRWVVELVRNPKTPRSRSDGEVGF